MDLLGDLGNDDQLTSAREENKVLKQRVKDLDARVHELNVENQSLLVEVEEYRREAKLPSFSKMALGEQAVGASGDAMETDGEVAGDAFVTSGNGVYPSDPAVSLPNLHGLSNPLCCSLHPDDAVLATGGADSHLSICQWGGALAPGEGAVAKVVNSAARIRCDGPVICVGFAKENRGTALKVVAAGCMDGSVKLVEFGQGLNFASGIGARPLISAAGGIKHGKYVKCLAWSPSAPILATGSADGAVQLTKIIGQPEDGGKTAEVQLENVRTMHLPGAIEAMCFLDNGNTLVCYARDTPYLSYFNLADECKQTKHNVNEAVKGFEDHVSFAIMHLVPSPNEKYLAAATDSHRNIIFEVGSAKQVRNLYGHKNDGFSQPKVAWSQSSQYLFGNTQEDNSICVWDVSSSSIVKRIEGHSGQIRDVFGSPTSDTVVTASYDKTVKVWLCGMS